MSIRHPKSVQFSSVDLERATFSARRGEASLAARPEVRPHMPALDRDYLLREHGCRRDSRADRKSSVDSRVLFSLMEEPTVFDDRTSIVDQLTRYSSLKSYKSSLVAHKSLRSSSSTDQIKLPKLLRMSNVHKFEDVRSQIRKKSLAQFSRKDLLRYRLAPDEAICDQLLSEGYVDCVAEIRVLVGKDLEIYNTTWLKKRVRTYPYLRDTEPLLQQLAYSLSEAERWGLSGNREMETKVMARLASFFWEQKREWWWIAKRLFNWAMLLAHSSEIRDSERLETMYRFMYATMLLEEGEELDKAAEEAIAIRNAAKGKGWTVDNDMMKVNGTLHEEASRLLSRIYTLKAAHSEEEDALQFYKNAVDRAIDCCDLNEQAETLLRLGQARAEVGLYNQALVSLAGYEAIGKKLDNHEKICWAHREMALLHLRMGNVQSAQKEMEIYLQMATDYELLELAAEAHCMLGELHLREDHVSVAIFYLTEAFSLYDHLQMMDERDLARLLCGIASAHESLCDYMKLLSGCTPTNYDAMYDLLRWKDNREAFWELEYPEIEELQPLPKVEADEETVQLKPAPSTLERMMSARIIQTSLVENLELVAKLASTLRSSLETARESLPILKGRRVT